MGLKCLNTRIALSDSKHGYRKNCERACWMEVGLYLFIVLHQNGGSMVLKFSELAGLSFDNL